MPIYEFYCSRCHTVFSFLSRAVDTTKRPRCPRCGRPRLERRISPFAISRGRSEEGGDPKLPDLDEARMEQAMSSLTHEAEKLDEDDPRAMAGLMRKLYHGMGLELGPGMEEAIRRMEAGDDPDEIEEEMGDLLEEEDPLLARGQGLRGLRRRARPPAVDRTLYEM